MTIKDIREALEATSVESLPGRIKEYSGDRREGVVKMLASFSKRYENYIQENARLETLAYFENKYSQMGYNLISGCDEAGRGPLAGPVCAGAVILPKGCRIAGMNDSKKLSPEKRESLYGEITEKAVAWAYALVSPGEIDRLNILKASLAAMGDAVKKLSPNPDFCLFDGNYIPDTGIKSAAIVRGDSASLSIAAASIVAKVTRDRLMEQYAKAFPLYGFEKHKGYGTAEHLQALKAHGPCPIHRMTFLKKEWL